MVRVRFAPSPTGYLHIGSARTALFNWVYAHRHGGKFLLRVEDTDLTRSESRFLDEIVMDLKWLGINWDEEPIHQSKRFDVYRASAESLISSGKAYREGTAYIFKMPPSRTIEVDDMIHGKVSFNTDAIKDQVMIKSDGSPAYNFACVIDDAHLKITHIIRGDDHLSNTPKQILFYEALGFDIPKFGHMPLIMGADGAKLSKRHGGVSVEEYKKEGYLPEALVNYLLLLGWSPGGDKEILTLEEAVKIFDIKNMTGVQAKFDLAKLRWINGEYLARHNSRDLAELIKRQMPDAVKASYPSDEMLLKLIDLYKVRIKTLQEFVLATDHFFRDDYSVDEKAVEKYLKPETSRGILREFAGSLEKIDEFSHIRLEEACRAMAAEKKMKPAEIIHPTRVAISGKTTGAGLFEMMEMLGKAKVTQRMRRAA